MGPLQQWKAAAIGTAGTGVDSRRCIFSFDVDSLCEVRAGLAVPSDLATVRAGVFFLQNDADWLGRRKNPARVLRLTEREVVVVAHRAAGEWPLRIPLDRLESIERDRILLPGWNVLLGRGPEEACVRHAHRGPGREVHGSAQGHLVVGGDDAAPGAGFIGAIEWIEGALRHLRAASGAFSRIGLNWYVPC